MNNNSIVLKIVVEESSFLFTGDAELESETDMLNAGYDLKTSVLKVGHHGSDTSSSEKFLDAVSPKMAIISVGIENSYGHPDKKTIEKLNSIGTLIYRTDEDGTVIIETDGLNFSILQEDFASQNMNEREMIQDSQITDPTYTNMNYPTQSEQIEATKNELPYIGNKNTLKFHKLDCYSLPAEKNRVSFNNRQNAVHSGFVPCKNCNP